MITNMFIHVLNMSISAGIGGLLLIAWRQLTSRHIPYKFYYLLWGTMFFRLTVPLSFTSVFSILSPRYAVDTAVGDSRFVVTMRYVDSDTVTQLAHSHGQGILLSALGVLWLAVALALILWWCWMYFRAQAALRYAVLYHDSAVDSMRARLGLHRPVRVYRSWQLTSPVVIGFVHPRIVLPYNMEGLSDTQQECVLAHEMIHLRRHDQFTKAILFFVCAFHWYNPVAWLCFYLFNQDIELSCDQEVLHHCGIAYKKHYASALVACAQQRTGFQSGYLSFARGGVAARVQKVLQYRRLPIWQAVLFAAATVFIGFSVSANPVLTDSYTYLPPTVRVSAVHRQELRQFTDDFAADLAAGDVRQLLTKSTADPAYFADAYAQLAASPPKVYRDKLFFTSDDTAVAYLRQPDADTLVLEIASSPIMGGWYAESLHTYADYEAIHTVDESNEAVMLCRKMIRHSLVSGENTPANAERIVAFCADIAHERGAPVIGGGIAAGAVHAIALEFFEMGDYTHLLATPAYNAATDTYLYDAGAGARFEYQILDLATSAEGAVVTVVFYRDPLQTEIEKTIQYIFRKVSEQQ